MLRGSTSTPRWVKVPLRQVVVDEHLLHRLQIELGGQIHDRHILVIEFAVLLGLIAVAVDQMPEEFAVRVDMPVEIHGHEAGELQEARIDIAHGARLGKRHAA